MPSSHHLRFAQSHRLTLLVGILLAVTISAQAAIELGRGFLIPELAVSSEYTTNVNNRADGEEDWINSFTPSLRYETQNSTTAINLTAGVRFLRYTERNESNTEDLFATADFSYPNGLDVPYSLQTGISVEENTQADAEFGRVTSNRNYGFSADGSYAFTSRYGISTGFSYSRTEPQDESAGLSRSATESFAVPISLNYRYSELLSYGLGYRIRQQASDAESNANESLSHAVFASASGQLLPRVSAGLQLGAQVQETDEGNEIGPYASGGLDWQASSLTSVGLSLSADFETTTGNRSSRSMSADASIRHNFATNWDGLLNLGLRQREFSQPGTGQTDARKDLAWSIGLGLETSFYEHTAISLALDYENNRSDDSDSEYDALRVTLSASRPF